MIRWRYIKGDNCCYTNVRQIYGIFFFHFLENLRKDNAKRVVTMRKILYLSWKNKNKKLDMRENVSERRKTND